MKQYLVKFAERAFLEHWSLTPEQRVLIRDEMLRLLATAESPRMRTLAARVLVAMNGQDIKLLDMQLRQDAPPPTAANVNVAVIVNDVQNAKQETEDWRQKRFAKVEANGSNGTNGNGHPPGNPAV